jgi:hypothetical protein
MIRIGYCGDMIRIGVSFNICLPRHSGRCAVKSGIGHCRVIPQSACPSFSSECSLVRLVAPVPSSRPAFPPATEREACQKRRSSRRHRSHAQPVLHGRAWRGAIFLQAPRSVAQSMQTEARACAARGTPIAADLLPPASATEATSAETTPFTTARPARETPISPYHHRTI